MYGNLVFVVDNGGDRFNNITHLNYSKVKLPDLNFNKLSVESLVEIFKPRDFFAKNFNLLEGVWKDIAEILIKFVSVNNIGIFGSTLIGFEVSKDVDFVVYGKDNEMVVRNNIDEIKRLVGAKDISLEHIKYQVKKYSQIHSDKNSFLEMLGNKWSSLQIGNILSTIRFVRYTSECTFDLFTPGEDFIFSGEVILEESSFFPRVFYLSKDNHKIRVITYFWAFQSCVKNGDAVVVFGSYDKNKDTIYLSKKEHYIKYQR